MALERLKQARKKTIGVKQTTKAIQNGSAQLVFVADDAEVRVTGGLIAACQDLGVPLERVDSMAALGKACGIEVGAATAAILEA